VRLFVAVEIDEEPRISAAALAQTLRDRAARIAPAAKITWVPPERLHITLCFIGHVSETRGAALAAALGRTIALTSFAIDLAGTGVFPPRGAPAVLWAGIDDPRGLLGHLEDEVSQRLSEEGVARESRPYRGHVTLARVRDSRGLRPRQLLDGLEAVRLGTTTVRAITLFESRLSPRGAQYVAVQRTSLLVGPGIAGPDPG
jgi:RNA 2',3'-cyclic 3'-phosphodiesterase